MKLLIITQKVDRGDPTLGFFHSWILEFAKHCELTIVICLQKGEYDFPQNVKVFSLGKEEKKSRFAYLFNFYKYILRERENYDAVFVHMNPEYVVLGGLFWRLLRKRVALWYTHKSVDLKLRIAEKFAHIVFTASKESFKLPSKKIHVMGHGIDINKFNVLAGKSDFYGSHLNLQAGHTTLHKENHFRQFAHIVTVGRISPVKDYETLIYAAKILSKKEVSFRIQIHGKAETPEQDRYLQSLHALVSELEIDEYVRFMGYINQDALPDILRGADVFVNMSHTGGLDKAILEAMACELPVLTCNETFVPMLEKCRLMFEKGNAAELAKKILWLSEMNGDERKKIGYALRSIIIEEHNLKKLVPRIISALCNK